MATVDVLYFVLLGAILGLAGQVVRVFVGIKKQVQKAGTKSFRTWFEGDRLNISLAIGATAGALAAVTLMGDALSKQVLLQFVAAGYAGADFIEGLMYHNLPDPS